MDRPPPPPSSVLGSHSACFYCIPEHVWDQVFDAMKDEPEALTNSFFACPEWRKLLERNKTEFMAPVVLSLVAKRNLLTSSELKGCRLVSRGWKGAVDALNGEVPQLIPKFSFPRGLGAHSFTFAGSTMFTMGMQEMYPWSRTPYQETLTYMSELTTRSNNPFPTRKVHLALFYGDVMLNEDFSYKYDHRFGIHPDNPAGFRERLMFDKYFNSMLESVGSHIWHLVLNLVVDYKDYLRNLVKMLKLVPNLKSLVLLRDTSHAGRTFWTGSAPILPSLVALCLPQLDCGQWIPRFLLTTYGSQLEALEVAFHHNYHLEYSFNKLKMLKLQTSARCLQNIGSRFSAPRLEKLIVDLGLTQRDVNPLWDLLVGLERFSSSLQVLYIDKIPASISEDDYMNLEEERGHISQFPRLSTFHINSCYASSANLEWFLKKCPALKEIRFHKQLVWNQVIDVERFFNILPTLQKVYGADGRKWNRSDVISIIQL